MGRTVSRQLHRLASEPDDPHRCGRSSLAGGRLRVPRACDGCCSGHPAGRRPRRVPSDLPRRARRPRGAATARRPQVPGPTGNVPTAGRPSARRSPDPPDRGTAGLRLPQRLFRHPRPPVLPRAHRLATVPASRPARATTPTATCATSRSRSAGATRRRSESSSPTTLPGATSSPSRPVPSSTRPCARTRIARPRTISSPP